MMHGHEKSDSVIVAGKPTNNADRSTGKQFAVERAAAEPVERRAGTKGNVGGQHTIRNQCWVRLPQAPEHMRQAVAVWTRGRSRMRESCTYGSVRGASSNGGPYRNPRPETFNRQPALSA